MVHLLNRKKMRTVDSSEGRKHVVHIGWRSSADRMEKSWRHTDPSTESDGEQGDVESPSKRRARKPGSDW